MFSEIHTIKGKYKTLGAEKKIPALKCQLLSLFYSVHAAMSEFHPLCSSFPQLNFVFPSSGFQWVVPFDRVQVPTSKFQYLHFLFEHLDCELPSSGLQWQVPFLEVHTPAAGGNWEPDDVTECAVADRHGGTRACPKCEDPVRPRLAFPSKLVSFLGTVSC